MNNMFSFKLLALFAVSSLMISCKKTVIETENSWGFYQPENFPSAVYTFENNAQTYKRFELGRALFYDNILSSDSSVSCATCHAQTHAFSAHNTAVSEGVGGQFGTRNSPGIFNMAWSSSFMWDGRINHLDVMPIDPITNPLEMNETMSNVVSKLQTSDKYKALFKNAYGTETVTEQLILKSLSQFMVMIISDNSKYDQMKRGAVSFSESEQQGYLLFQAKCVQCHSGDLFTDQSFRNNGLDATFTDQGRFSVTNNPMDLGKFKVPSLRNVELTYPYMHDGRFFTLSQVLNHYSQGITPSSTLDENLAGGIPLTATEKTQLISFLKTLTDYSLLGNAHLKEP